MGTPSAVFLIQLVQDVNVLRPLIFMAARDFQFSTQLLIPKKFLARDPLGIWRRELEIIGAETGAAIHYFDDHWRARRQLTGGGLLFSASESSLPNHTVAHEIFGFTPASYLRVTLQHGYECVGFRHSANHVRAYGQSASFAADLLCTWAPAENLPSLAPSQRVKVVVTGPSLVLQQYPPEGGRRGAPSGLVCENLHSVRFAGAEKAKSDFADMFIELVRVMALEGHSISLRPHPGGQFFMKNRTRLPDEVTIENAPTYRVNLSRYSYGISSPSSVLIEMLLAGIPTAVWRDSAGLIDTSAYDGLTMVDSVRHCVEFARAAVAEPAIFRRRQREFLERTAMLLNPCEVYERYAQVFQAAGRMIERRG